MSDSASNWALFPVLALAGGAYIFHFFTEREKKMSEPAPEELVESFDGTPEAICTEAATIGMVVARVRAMAERAKLSACRYDKMLRMSHQLRADNARLDKLATARGNDLAEQVKKIQILRGELAIALSRCETLEIALANVGKKKRACR